MTWSEPASGILVEDRDTRCAPVQTTSISLVLVPAPHPAEPRVMRLYGLEAGVVQRTLDYVSEACPELSAPEKAAFDPLYEAPTSCAEIPWVTGQDEPDAYVQYIDAVDWPRFVRNPNGELVLRLGDTRGGEPLLHSTCIPKHRAFPLILYTQLDYLAGTSAIASSPGFAYYDGVDVLQLPDGRWLMLMHRYLTLTGRDVAGTPVGTLRSWTGAHCSFTDILCYVADDPEFHENVRGPYWVVEGRNALPDDELPQLPRDAECEAATVRARVNVGVPSGVVVGDELFVYYVVGDCKNFGDREGEALGTRCNAETVGGDPVDTDLEYDERDEYSDALAELGFTAGIACKRISLYDLYAFIATVRDDLNVEPAWDYWQAEGASLVVPGTLLGRVRFWTDHPDSLGWQRLEEILPSQVNLIDPAALWCGHRLNLFFPATKCPPGTVGCGVWRAAAIEWTFMADTSYDIITMEFGRDFYVATAWEEGAWTSSDLIASFEGEGEYQNPAVIVTDDAMVRVFLGGGEEGTFVGSGNNWELRATLEEACAAPTWSC